MKRRPIRHSRKSAAEAGAPRLVFADEAGRLYDHPALLAAVPEGRAGAQPAPGEEFRAAPATGASAGVAMLPGRLPVGFDPGTGRLEVVEKIRIDGRTVRPTAVAALLPPGWTRTRLPAFKTAGLSPVLPLYGYAAAGWRGDGLVVAGMRTDPRDHWNPALYSTPDLEDRIRARLAEDPTNRVLLQTARCAHEYRCFTAQNVFYRRWEGAIPMSPACNAQCVGCISEQDPESGPPPSQWRIAVGPDVDECVRMAVPHLEVAGDGAIDERVRRASRGEPAGRRNADQGRIVSWGQGCEGEPLLRADAMAEAIRAIRRKTSAGTLHVNTNGSVRGALPMLAEAGLDSCRISLNAAEPGVYEAYYRPTGYGWRDVAANAKAAKEAGLYVSLNLLVFPGVSDLPRQADALASFVAEAKPDLIQTRNLCLDPDAYLGSLPEGTLDERPVGLPKLFARLLEENPALSIGNYNVPREEFGRRILPP